MPFSEDDSDNLYEFNGFKQAIDSVEGLEYVRRELFKPQKQAAPAPSNAVGRSNFADEASYLRYCLDEIRNSKSYKVGLALTWLPRKMRGL